MSEDEMDGWHHRWNGHELEQISGDGEGQRSLVGYSQWGHKESDLPEDTHRTYNVVLVSNVQQSVQFYSFSNYFPS